MTPISILDLTPIKQGGNAAASLRETYCITGLLHDFDLPPRIPQAGGPRRLHGDAVQQA